MDKGIRPFLKWPGGKQWLFNKISLPKDYGVFYEPFLGGGSFFFNLAPRQAILSDLNSDLINLYCVMRDNPKQLKDALIKHNTSHSKEYYYRIRALCPDSEIERAARFLYLNRTCFNGMYRVNRNGFFNVPIGSKTNCIYDIDEFEKYSAVLKKSKIYCGDFSNFICTAKENDFVFCDPPYRTMKSQNQFIKYNDFLFCWEDQLRLLESLKQAKEKGVVILSTNANTKDIIEMYSDNGFFVSFVSKYCSISGSPKGRGRTEELIISSYAMDKVESP